MTTNPGLEGITLSTFLFARLTEDDTLQGLMNATPDGLRARVVEGTAPEGTPYPLVSFTIVEPQDVKGVGQVHLMSMVEAQVKVVDQGETYPVAIYQRVHQLLESLTLQEVQGGGIVLTCHRVSAVQYPEQANGIQYRHLGGLYRTETQ